MNRAAGYVNSTNKFVDSVCAVGVILLIFTSRNADRVPAITELLNVPLTVRHVMVGMLLWMVWHSCFALCGLHTWGHRGEPRRRRLALRIIGASTLGTLLVWGVTVAVASDGNPLRLRVLFFSWCVVLAAESVGRGFVTVAFPFLRKRTTDVRQVVIVGSGARAQRLFEALHESESAECQILGFVDDVDGRDLAPEVEARLLGPLDGLEALLSSKAIDQVLITLPVKSFYEAIQRAIDLCEKVGVEVIYYPDIFSVSLARREYAHDSDRPAVRLLLAPNDHRLAIKRVIDLAAVTLGGIVLSPLLLACAIAVKLSGPGPILFSQLRYGYNRRIFRMYKFRTMVSNAEQLQSALETQNEAGGPIFKIRADPRITKIGRVMRKLSLDELPQLINVFRGEMSLVGPRPMSTRDVSRFSESWLLRRFSVKPGLTCLWQINGRSNTTFDRWVELDLAYIDNWSLALDMRILLKTVPAVLSGNGAM